MDRVIPNNDKNSIFLKNIERGKQEGLIVVTEDNARITYFCSREYSVSFKNPEETVRASYFVELILDYQYPPAQIDIEVAVPRRTPEDRADIVVYEDIELKNPYLVVECKKDGITDAEFKQAIEQAFGNANSLRAKFATVVAGTTKTAFDIAGFKPNEREKNVIADIPQKYGRTPQYRFIKGETGKELKTVSRDELITALGKSHDTVWQGGKLAPTTAFDEVSKLLFCKLRDEKLTKRGEVYKFQIGTHETADEVYDRVNSIYLKAKQEDSEVFKEDIRLDKKVVYSVVEHLQELAINKIDLDTKGIAFERFMEDFFKGKMGQFFTPREIIRFCVDMLKPQRGDLVLDPACGSGGFLLNALDAIREFTEKNYDEGEAREIWHSFAMNNLYGIEINDQIARVCKMNMIIHDDGHTNIISTDSLRDIDEISEIYKSFQKDRFDVVLTNPPFGATVKSTEKNYLDHYELGKGKKNQSTEILFIERCLDFLKDGGRIAIVLPDSIAINTSLQYVRDYILKNTQVLAIISLPDYAFAHFGANVKSSLFFLNKKSDFNEDNYTILFAQAGAIGYTASGKLDVNNDLPSILNAFNKFEKGDHVDVGDNIYTVSLHELIGRRIDPKGYSPKYKRLKQNLLAKYKGYIPLKKLLIDFSAGDWGVDEKKKEENIKYIQCYVLRNTNFDNDFNLDLSDVAVRWIKSENVGKLQLFEDDILVEKSGGSPYQPVGRVAIIDKIPSDKPVVFSNFLQRIRIDSKKINPKFVYAYLRVLYHLDYMEYIQNQTTGIKNLLMGEFEEIQIPLLEETEQKKFADKLIDSFCLAKETIKGAYNRLREDRNNLANQVK